MGHVKELKRVVDETGAKIVVTSRRRGNYSFGNFFSENDLFYIEFIKPLEQMGIEIYDYTPFIQAKDEEARELEIEAYLRCHPEIEEFVIIEDDFVMQRLYQHQIFIEYSDGFVSRYVDPSIQILNGNLGFYPPEYDRSETFQERIERLFPSLFSNQDVPSDEALELAKVKDILDEFECLDDNEWEEEIKKLKLDYSD